MPTILDAIELSCVLCVHYLEVGGSGAIGRGGLPCKMQLVFRGLSVQSIGAALISSDLGASELIVGLLVAMPFVACAANSLIARHEGQAWSRRAAPPR